MALLPKGFGLAVDLEERAAAASYKPEYEHTKENIAGYWRILVLFALGFAFIKDYSASGASTIMVFAYSRYVSLRSLSFPLPAMVVT